MNKLNLLIALASFGLIFSINADAQTKKIGMEKARQIAGDFAA